MNCSETSLSFSDALIILFTVGGLCTIALVFMAALYWLHDWL